MFPNFLYDLLGLCHQLAEVADGSLCVRVLEDDATDILACEIGFSHIPHLHCDPEGPGPGLDTGDGLGVELIRQQEPETQEKL